MRVEPVRLTWLYILVLGAGLILDGALLLVLNALGAQISGVNTTDVPHNVLHVVSGIVLLAVSVRSQVRAMWAAVVFGAFYTALGIIGLTIDRPFGLQLGPGENAFHLIVGPLALVMGAWALKSSSLTPVPLHSAVRQDGLGSAPAARRRARHRPGTAHGRRRRH
jgi:hypothetical protein